MIRFISVTVGLIYIVSRSDAVLESPLTAIHPEVALLQHWKVQKSWEERHDFEKSEKLMHAVRGNLTSSPLQHQNGSHYTECIKSLMHFSVDTVHKESYALKALDADGKLSSGIMLGNIKWSGRYHECQQIKAENFNGKWCQLTQVAAIQQVVGSIGFSLGLCLPDTCPEEFFDDAIHLFMGKNGTNDNFTVRCPVQLTEWTAVDVASMLVFSVLLILVVLGTVVDIFLDRKHEKEAGQLSINGDGIEIDSVSCERRKPSVWAETATSFSVIKNTRTLLTTVSRPGTIDVLHGIRFISITWVVLGHTFAMILGTTDNVVDMLDWFIKALSFQAIANATFSVDSFFFLSGLLVTYLALKDSNRFTGRNIPFMYLQRYIRLTPTYALMILFSVGFYGKLGEGPFWPEYFNVTRTPCVDKWWTNLIYVNNLYPSELLDECYALGWYLANDMQFFLLAPFSILLLKWRPKLGVNLLVFGVFSSVLVTGIISAHYQAQPQPIGLAILAKSLVGGTIPGGGSQPNGTNHVANLGMPPMSPKDAFWSDTYAKPWCRIGVYLIGMMTGYILHATQSKIKISKLFAICGWALAAVLNAILVYGLWPYVRTGTPMVVSLAAFYDAMCRPMWAVGLAWVVIACATGYGGPVNTFLSWKLFVPLSRLTFCIYLVHPLIINWWFYSLEVTVHFSNTQFAFFFLAVLTSSVALAYVVSMLAEFPFTNLSKMLIRRRTLRRQQQAENQRLLDAEDSDP